MENRLNVLCQSSDFYCPFCGVMLESLFYNNTDIETIKVYLISDNIGEDNMRKLKELSEKYGRVIEIIDGKILAKHLEENGCPKYNGSYATYFKIFAPEYIKDGIDRMLYLDCDIIVNGSIKDLIYMDMNDKSMSMTFDLCQRKYVSQILKLDCQYYYNAGVILFDIKKYINSKVTSRIIEHIKNVRSNYFVADQDLFNVVTNDEISALDMIYNFGPDLLEFKSYSLVKEIYDFYNYYSEEQFYSAMKNPVIIHYYAGCIVSRPWCKGSENCCVKEWDKYWKQSPWSDFEKIDDKTPFIHKFQRMLYKILPKRVFAFINRKATDYIQARREKMQRKK